MLISWNYRKVGLEGILGDHLRQLFSNWGMYSARDVCPFSKRYVLNNNNGNGVSDWSLHGEKQYFHALTLAYTANIS